MWGFSYTNVSWIGRADWHLQSLCKPFTSFHFPLGAHWSSLALPGIAENHCKANDLWTKRCLSWNLCIRQWLLLWFIWNPKEPVPYHHPRKIPKWSESALTFPPSYKCLFLSFNNKYNKHLHFTLTSCSLDEWMLGPLTHSLHTTQSTFFLEVMQWDKLVNTRAACLQAVRLPGLLSSQCHQHRSFQRSWLKEKSCGASGVHS